jgi:hypothetical protein
MTKTKITIAVLMFAAACSKGGDKDKGGGGGGGGETTTVDLAASGYVVDVPKGWTVDSQMKGFYDFKDNGHMAHGAPQIMESDMPAGTVDDAVKSECDGRTDVQKGTFGANGWWVTCKGESKMMKGLQTTQIKAVLPKDDKSSFDCHLETDKDPAAVLAICKSIRKK